MNVLVGCEQSQEVAAAFIALGHDAMSCDLYYDGEKGLPHFRGDVFHAINLRKWDLIILHPPCTYTSLSGNRWYFNSPLRVQGAEFCRDAWNAARSVCDKVALEQPKTVMQKYIGLRSQSIQPYEFGHGEVKETWLWLSGLPLLIPTNIVDGRLARVWRMAPGPYRQRERSRTYSGIAAAMACQWG